ncbi:MAG: T9SS type A sorting domain-containing protein [Flavobacteriales bacterium]|nr:T9SS type A sorting domain-containing protein [Flavobacteriales bacterium]
MQSLLNCYCTATYSNGCGFSGGDAITNVSLNGWSNASGCAASPYYTYFFPSVSQTTLQEGASYTLSITMGADGNQYSAAWIDYNRDGIFQTSETVGLSGNAGSNGTATLNFTVPSGITPGITRLRVRGGNDSALLDTQACGASSSTWGETEDYDISLSLAVPCAGVPDPGNTTATVCAVLTGGNATLGLQNPTLGTGVTYQWFSGPSSTGPWTSFGGSAATQAATGIDATTWYYCEVTCTSPDGGAASSNPISVNAVEPACAAGSTLLDENMTNISFAGINNNSGLASYSFFTCAGPAQVFNGVSYPFSATVAPFYTDTKVLVWIDYNRNGTFDTPDELAYESAVAGPFTGTITIPATITPGIARMRVRVTHTNPDFGTVNQTPCGTSNYGEVEDYLVNLVQCAIPTATFTSVDNCDNSQFSVDVNVSAFGLGTSGNLSYTVNGGSPVVQALSSTGLVTVGPFGAADYVQLSVTNSQPACGAATGVGFSTCPVVLDCGSELIVYHCYTNNDTRTFTFINPDEGLISIEFLPSSPVAAGDGVNFYDGPVGVNQISVPPFGSDLSNLPVITSPNDVFSIEVTSNASGSCADGGAGAGPWNIRVLCKQNCTPPEADVFVENDCDIPGFYLNVDLYDLGGIYDEDAEEVVYPNSAGIRIVVNGGSPTDYTGLTEDLYTYGPFPLNSVVAVTLLNEENELCNNFLGNFVRDPAVLCAGANDLCANAVPLAVNPFGSCMANSIEGTTQDAGNETLAPTCQGDVGPISDVWYSFNSGYQQPITISVQGITAGHVGWQIFAACGEAQLYCAPTPSVDVVGFAPNTNYLLRVFTNSSLGAPGTFNVCLNYPTTNFDHATCAQALAIPDNGCAANNFALGTFAIAGAPVGTLGTNVALESVELIVQHTWNSDMQIYLVSPSQQQIPLVLNRGGSADNFGNPSACPAQVMTLRDGFPAASTIPATNNVVGTFSPEQPLSGFNVGEANGNWSIRVCDGATGDVGTVRYVKLNFVCLGVAATASNNGPVCTGGDVQLTTTTAEDTNFSWTGPNGFSSNAQNPVLSNVSVANSGVYTVTVTSATNSCPTVRTTNVVVNPIPAGPSATGNYAICQNGTIPGGQGLTATYTVTSSAVSTFGGAPFNSPGPVTTVSTINVPALPAGATLTGATLTLNSINAINGSWRSEFRVALSGAYTLAATQVSSLGSSGLITPDPVINLTSFPTSGGTINLVLSESFDDGGVGTIDATVAGAFITVTYIAPVVWSDAATGGNQVGTGSPFNPVATNAVNPNVGGLYTFYAGVVDGNGCVSPRLPAYFSVGDNSATLEFYTTDNPADLSWQIEDVATNAVLYNGQGFMLPPNSTFPLNYCLPNGRDYKLRVTDNGDGASGYQLRNTSDQARMIDNFDNLGTGISEITGNPYSFSMPVGSDELIYTSCDKYWWKTNEYIVAAENAAVSALWIDGGANNVQSNNTGYEFWFYNPNGGYSFRKFRPHNVSDGYGNVGATRACHLKVNNWAVANHIPQFDLMNVRVRSRVSGVNSGWGAACRFVRDEALSACPPTKLMDIPGNQFLSCNQFRQFGVAGSRIHARPVTGANLFQWRFRIEAENVEIIRTSTSYFLNLNWNAGVAAPLLIGKTYEVDVRASKDGGATWCGLGGDPWGDICSLTIGTPPAVDGNQNMSLSADGVLAMWPNPNNGTEVWISLDGIDASIETVTVDIHDLFGKRVSARILPTQDGSLLTALPLNGDLAAGMYMVTVIAGDAQYVQRLVIQP